MEAVRALGARAAAGDSLVFFPEGTFGRLPGLLPFKLGAFAVAAQAHLPLVPVALRGSRELLSAGTWRLQRHDIVVCVGAPLAAGGRDWSAAVALRDEARTRLLQMTGEPDLTDRGRAMPGQPPASPR